MVWYGLFHSTNWGDKTHNSKARKAYMHHHHQSSDSAASQWILDDILIWPGGPIRLQPYLAYALNLGMTIWCIVKHLANVDKADTDFCLPQYKQGMFGTSIFHEIILLLCTGIRAFPELAPNKIIHCCNCSINNRSSQWPLSYLTKFGLVYVMFTVFSTAGQLVM